mgnify:CR=1 FL=1
MKERCGSSSNQVPLPLRSFVIKHLSLEDQCIRRMSFQRNSSQRQSRENNKWKFAIGSRKYHRIKKRNRQNFPTWNQFNRDLLKTWLKAPWSTKVSCKISKPKIFKLSLILRSSNFPNLKMDSCKACWRLSFRPISRKICCSIDQYSNVHDFRLLEGNDWRTHLKNMINETKLQVQENSTWLTKVPQGIKRTDLTSKVLPSITKTSRRWQKKYTNSNFSTKKEDSMWFARPNYALRQTNKLAKVCKGSNRWRTNFWKAP